MEVAAVVQVRMGSTRLPGKAMMKVGGKPLLDILLTRLRGSSTLDGIVVCTTELPMDDVIEDFCDINGYECYRGSQDDVLNRYNETAERFNIEKIVRVTGDNPLTDIKAMDELIEIHRKGLADYSHCRGFPLGTATEVVNSAALRSIYHRNLEPYYKEHVTLFFHDHPLGYKICSLDRTKDKREGIRLTVDTQQDLELIIELHRLLGDLSRVDTERALDLIIERPELSAKNSSVKQKDPRE